MRSFRPTLKLGLSRYLLALVLVIALAYVLSYTAVLKTVQRAASREHSGPQARCSARTYHAHRPSQWSSSALTTRGCS